MSSLNYKARIKLLLSYRVSIDLNIKVRKEYLPTANLHFKADIFHLTIFISSFWDLNITPFSQAFLKVNFKLVWQFTEKFVSC